MFQVYEFFYGVFKVGLNTQQKESCNSLFSYTKFHNETEVKFRRNCTKQTCLCLFRVLAGIDIFIFHHAPTSGTSMLPDNFMKICLKGHLIVLLQMVRFVKGQIICRLTNSLLFCQFPRPDNCRDGSNFPLYV